MSETVSTEQVRHAYADGLAGTSRSRAESGAEFNLWLNSVKAEARSEGFDCGTDNTGFDDTMAEFGQSENPYRAKEEACVTICG